MDPTTLLIWLVVGAAALFIGVQVTHWLRQLRAVTVYEFQAALEYRNGAFVRTLGPGHYRSWSQARQIYVEDLREQSLEISGQEMLTADQMALKASLIVRYAISDARKVHEATTSAYQHLYTSGQLALRASVAQRDLEACLADRDTLSQSIQDNLATRLAGYGVELRGAEVRDLMLSGEMKRAYADVFRVRKEGEVALERARAEQASLRSLANAARMLKSNPGLASLRTLQTVDAAASKGATLVIKLNNNAGAGDDETPETGEGADPRTPS